MKIHYISSARLHIDLESITAISEVDDGFPHGYRVHVKLHDSPMYIQPHFPEPNNTKPDVFREIFESIKAHHVASHTELIRAWRDVAGEVKLVGDVRNTWRGEVERLSGELAIVQAKYSATTNANVMQAVVIKALRERHNHCPCCDDNHRCPGISS